MDIKELEDYRLSDAVKFHTHLNPRIWGSDEHLLPEVREKLLAIAADFKEFLGLDLEVKDITISGSNAAYTYTDHSDIDLHLVTDLPKADIGELYRELFDAKKYQYNDQHDFTIGGYPVELYVQNASLDHKSQGIYSVVDNDWVSVPRRRQPDIDDISVKSKYEDLGNRIELAIKSGDAAQLEMLGKKVREFRQAGLDQTGEFGPENLAFKVLRSNGTLDRLRAARQAARNQELSIDEAGKKKKKKSFRYGFGGYYYPGYHYYGQTDAATDGGGDAGTENVKESADNIQAQLEKFAAYCSEKLGIENAPRIQLKRDPAWSQRNATFGHYMPEVNTLTLSVANRHPMDIMRTLAHELVHRRQDEIEPMPGHAGDTGSEWENEANAQAGVLMRDWGAENPGMFDKKPLGEGKIILSTDPNWYGATINNYKATGPVTNISANQLVGFEPDDKMNQPKSKANVEKIAAGLKKGDKLPPLLVRKYKKGYQVLDGHHRFWAYKSLGVKSIPVQVVPASDIEEKGQQVVAEASGYIPATDAEARDPRYSMAITQDIKPGEVKRQTAKMGWKTTAAGTPPTARTNGLVESLQRRLQQVKAETLTEQQLDEVNMSPGALQSWAKEHAGGMKAGFEAELIFRDQLDDQADDEGDMEPDYDADERADSIDDIIEFFSAEMGRRALDELRREMYENYSEWQADSILEAFDNRIHVTIKEYLEENDWNWQEKIAEYLQDEMDKTAEESDAIMNQDEENDDGSENEDYVLAMQAVEDQLDKRIDLAVQEGSDNADWQGAYDNFAENFDNDEQDWLRSLGIRNMTDVDDHFSVDWPHWQSVDNGSSADGEYHRDTAEILATSLRNKFGVKTQVESSTRGDTAKRSTPGDVWVFEADGSLRPDDKTDMPVEIVSPPMPLKQTLAIMPEFFKWASSEGAYANKSTGLHMSVSMPEHAGDNLDYVKAALFLGDQYVLDQFGRAASTYSQSAIKEIKSKIDARRKSLIPADNLVTKAFEQMRTKLNSMATQAFARPSGFGKYFTINPKDKYIEFRSAGGKDYIEDIPKLQNTLLRYARAMSIGMDPAAEKAEYAKKLYKLLGNVELQQNPADTTFGPTNKKTSGSVSAKSDKKDAIWYFTRYAAGELTESDLKQFVKQMQGEREAIKRVRSADKMWWKVYYASYGPSDGPQIEVVARNPTEAVAVARKEWGITSATHRGFTDNDFVAEPLRMLTPAEIEQTRNQFEPQAPAQDDSRFAYDPESNPTGNFVIRRRDPDSNTATGPVIYRFRGDDTDDAVEHARRWMMRRGIGRSEIWLATSESTPEAILNAVPPAPGTPAGDRFAYDTNSDPNGNYVIRRRDRMGNDGTGPVIYRFTASGVNDALDQTERWKAARGLDRLDVWLSQSENVPPGILNAAPNLDTIPTPGITDGDRTSDTGYWVVFDGATGSNLDNLAFLPARSSQDAQLAYRQWYQRTGYMFGSDARFIMRPGDHIDVQDARDRGLPTPPPMPANLPQTLAPSSSDDNGRWQRTEWNIVDNDTGQVLHTFSGPGVTQGVANTMAAAWLEAEGPEDADMTEISVVPVPRSTIQNIPLDIAQNFIPGSTLDLQQQRQAAATPLRVRTTVGEPRPAFREPRANSIPEVPLDIAQNFQDPPASWDGGSPIETEPQNFPAAGSTGGEFTGQWNIVNSNTGEIVHTFGGAGNVQADANQAAARWARQTRFDDPIEVYPQMR